MLGSNEISTALSGVVEQKQAQPMPYPGTDVLIRSANNVAVLSMRT